MSIFHITHTSSANAVPSTIGFASTLDRALTLIVEALLFNGSRYELLQVTIEEHAADIDLSNRSPMNTYKGEQLKNMIADAA